ncbi:MAG: response regulator transcription factor [Betaproteobacteria bacterium]|nr:response regulator transcription factor [Betaproteobacteria bacterium]
MKLLIVDDYALARDGLRQAAEALSPDILVLEAQNAAEAFALLEADPDIHLVLLDLMLPGVNGFSALEQMRRQFAGVPVVVISSADQSRDVVRVLNAGAMGFIPKSSKREIIVRALRLVLSGGVYIPIEVLGRRPNSDEGTQARRLRNPEETGLTERQRQTLRLVGQGKPNKVIARELGIAEATVKAHITEIFRALKVTNRAQAAIAAHQFDL